MKPTDAALVRATVQAILERTPKHAAVCRPLSRALMARIAEELKNVSRETKPAERDQPANETGG